MKSFIVASFLILSFLALSAQEMNKVIVDSILQKKVLVGYCNREGLQSGEFAEYFSTEYKNYNPDPVVLSALKKSINKCCITIVMGTWCSDSQEQVPRFYKILDQLNYKEKKLTVICVDRSKKARTLDISTLKMEKVPTFIIYRKGTEAGRIIETPVKNLEEDLLAIIQKSSRVK